MKKWLFLIILFIWFTFCNHLDILLGIHKKNINYYLIVFPLGLGISLLILYLFLNSGKNKK
ncbi:putative membrane protein [Saccharococcus thermophilus]|uniref:Putative membrane protein n=1 Tax=Saccharococcus thermophilus TaxID=29396 RepID=A0A846MEA7_9BACL|nr:putative membrane protein [Saccharococcus thermophilus]